MKSLIRIAFALIFIGYTSSMGLAQSEVITTYARPQLPTDGSMATNQATDYPTSVAPDGAGGFYMTLYPQNMVYRVAADGNISFAAGNGTQGFSGDGGQATSAQLYQPECAAVDAGGNLLIADTLNNRIRKVAPDGVISTAVFSFKQNGVTVSEAGVPASPPTTAARVSIDYRSSAAAIPARPEAGTIDLNTGIAVANPGVTLAHITYKLRKIGGRTLSQGQGTLDPGAHFARSISQLHEEAPDFVLPEDFQTATQFASLEISSDQPVSIIAMRMAINLRNDVLFTTTPIADLTQPLTNPSVPIMMRHLPHVNLM